MQTHESPLRRASNTPLVLEGLAALRLVLLNDSKVAFLGRVVVENLADENLTLPLLLLKAGEDEVPAPKEEAKETGLVGDEGYCRSGKKKNMMSTMRK